MKRIHTLGDCLEYARAYGFDETDNDIAIATLSLKTKMYNDAIYNDGIVRTFSFSENCYDLVLDYIKIESKDIELYPDMFRKQTNYEHIYLHGKTDQSILTSCLTFGKTHETDDKLRAKFEEIKETCVETYNGIYSSVEICSVNIDENNDISIPYTYYCIKDEFIDKISSHNVIFGKAPLPYEKWFNLGSHSTDDSSRIDGIALTKDVEAALNKGYIDCTPPDFTTERCYSEKALKEVKENSNMKIHLLIVPKGMSEEFVNNTKKNLQTNDNTILYLSSNDITFEPSDKYKTKYDLFEYWITFGKIYCVEFMIGYESDPEAKAFETFIRGIRNISTLNIVNLRYQKDSIEKVIDNLRKDYAKSSIARSNLNNITDMIMDKVRFFKEYGLEDNDFDDIRNADCVKDAYNATVNKITEIAFASDKKGSKGNKK